ncbi:hypothetical protein SAMN05216226_11616 [Halovenus aranensis]|uniref:Uncharacterized protein n=1 Tax=Halovenus aranensis TaxID=890420 RepID=A0A1G8YTV5_9EURY|nr:DUF5787 family protein [Halovenus aranensis]SDK05864.1 hypothetical protein SAMN05216226_11616 [Halovenus aranensis]
MSTEFGFELQVCQWAEDHWPPGKSRDSPVVVARQLGTKRRRWDTVVIECDPEGLAARANFGSQRLDSDLLHVVRNAPAAWAWYREALPDPGYPWRYVRQAVHQAADRGLIERRRGDGGRIELRRKWPYPDWVERIVAVENKPDLDASAARNLAPQLERDVALGLADAVWVATGATGGAVEPVLLEDIPVESGVLTVERDSRGASAVEATWQPRALDPTEPGTRIVDRPEGGTFDASACQFEVAAPDWKASKRLEIAERAYERGWRSYADSMRPDCRHFVFDTTPAVARPACEAKDCHQTQRECAGSCPEFEPEPPAWRQRDWPLEGGPGRAIKRLLDRQRERQRPGE